MEGPAGRIVAEQPRFGEIGGGYGRRPEAFEGVRDAGQDGLKLMGHRRDA
jgi:hypothetical protein